MRQTNLDLRAAFAQAAANETDTAPRGFAYGIGPKAAAPRGFVTPGRLNLIKTMLAERFAPAEAERRFAAMDWDTMDRALFDRIMAFLRATPKLETEQAPVRPVLDGSALLEGKFTVLFQDGEHITFRIKRQDAKDRFMPGQLIIERLVGTDNNSDYKGVAHVNVQGRISVWKKHQANARLAEALGILAGDPLAAAKGYAAKSGVCPFCHNDLTHPDSLHNGWGEKCATKRGLPYEKAPLPA